MPILGSGEPEKEKEDAKTLRRLLETIVANSNRAWHLMMEHHPQHPFRRIKTELEKIGGAALRALGKLEKK